MTPQDLTREEPPQAPWLTVGKRAAARKWRVALRTRGQALRSKTPAVNAALALRDAGDEGFVQLLRKAGL